MTITDKEVKDLATSMFSSQSSIETGRVSYLRQLIAATQGELKKRGEPAPAQLAALSLVHERFYALILEAAQPFVPRTQKNRAVLLHKRANFARTALSALRSHVRAGGDIGALSPAKATKATLSRHKAKTTPTSAKAYRARAEAQSKALIATLLGMADADKAAAVEEMRLVLGQLAAQFGEMGGHATKDAAQAAEDGRPLRIGKVVYMPALAQPAANHEKKAA